MKPFPALALGVSLFVSSGPASAQAVPGPGVPGSNQSLTEQAKLEVAAGAQPASRGVAVAISGDTALLGAPNDGGNTGSASVFARQGACWSELQTLSSSDGNPYDYFGAAVGIDGDTIVVGALNDTHSGVLWAGSAYVFARSGSSWVQQAKLIANDPAENAEFGYGAAVSGDTILVGASLHSLPGAPGSGAVYVFVRAGTIWTQTAKLLPNPPTPNGWFGSSIALEGSTAVVGAYGENSAFVFVGSGTTWTQQAVLPSPEPDTHFGRSVSVSNETVLVGAEYDVHQAGIPNGLPGEGSAFVFVRQQSSWSLQAQLQAFDARPYDNFGHAVGLAGDLAVLGANLDNHAYGTPGIYGEGSAYAFERVNGSWNQLNKLAASDAQKYDSFGSSVAIDGRTVVAGAPGSGFLAEGASYVFQATAARPRFYCTAGVSAQGCQATLGTLGEPSASASAGFELWACGVQGGSDGLFFFGANGRQANPWGNGTSLQCVAPPVKRTAVLQNPVVNPGCDGSLFDDLNAHWTAKPAHNPGSGAVVQTQLWYRDPQNTSNQTASLSEATEFTVGP